MKQQSGQYGSKKKESRINENISAKNIFLVDQDGEQIGVVSRLEALQKAQESSLDLVQVAVREDEVAVCRIMDYGKTIYEKKKKVQGQKKKQKRIQLKEIKFKPNTDQGDYQVKLNKIKKFLQDGDKVKVSIQFRGREMMHKDIGVAMLHRVEADLEGLCVIEQASKQEGRQIHMVLAPK